MHERMLDRSRQPTEAEMQAAIGEPFAGAWSGLRRFLAETYAVEPVFNAGGQKYGWNLQYRLGGRPLCELYPEHGSFTALVILGRKELDLAIGRLEGFGGLVRHALTETPRFHDGCWMYIQVSDPQTCEQDGRDVQELILIKRKPPRKKPS